MTQVKEGSWSGGNEPLISIIMNCYNGEKFVGDAIESILAQTYENWELVFWDNQSTDASADVVKSYDDERIRYFCSDKHTILYEARGYAYAETKGELIAFLDVDDQWYPEKLEKQVGLFDDEGVGMVYANFHKWDTGNDKKWLAFDEALPEGNALDDLLNKYSVGILTLVLRRKTFESLEVQFDSRFHIIGDFDLVIRMASRWKVGAVQSPLACYRIHQENETGKNLHLTVRETLEWYREYEKDEMIGASKSLRKVKRRITYVKAIALISDNQKISALRCLGNMSFVDSIKTIIQVIVPLWLIRLFR